MAFKMVHVYNVVQMYYQLKFYCIVSDSYIMLKYKATAAFTNTTVTTTATTANTRPEHDFPSRTKTYFLSVGI